MYNISMSVTCSTCGKESQDPEFCDHCNADLGKSGQSLPPERCLLTPAGVPLSLEQQQVLSAPESSIDLEADGQRWRIHWVSDSEWRSREAQIQQRLALQLPALPPGKLIEDGTGRWLAFETANGSTPPWQKSPRSD